MGPLLLKVGSPILLIGGLIFIHELGHFLVAKFFNVKVLRFSIGFGPKLLGFRRGETEYWIAAVPLGGYVKMAGEDPTEAPLPEDRGRGFLEQAPWKRSLIALAGPVMNLAFPVAIYFCVFYFQASAVSSRAGFVDPDSPAYQAGIRNGDRVVEIDGKPVKYFHEMRDLVSPKAEQLVHLKVERPDGSGYETDARPKKIVERDFFHEETRGILGVQARQPAPVVAVADPGSPAAKAGLRSLDRLTRVAGSQVKVLFDAQRVLAQQAGPFEVEYLREEPLAVPGAGLVSYVKHTARIESDGKSAGLEGATGVVAEVAPGSPAAAAGLQRGDKLLTANGKPLPAWSTLERLRAESKTEPIALEVLRDGQKLQVQVTQSFKTEEDEVGQPTQRLFFGALPDTTDEPGELIPVHYGVAYSLNQALHIVPETIGQVVKVLQGLFTRKVALKTVGGPGMLVDIAGKSAEAGWDSFLSAMAAISINLGVMNLIPIPVLDGFQVLAAGFEWIRRRPISLNARVVANVIGLVMLACLMIAVLTNDVLRYLPR